MRWASLVRVGELANPLWHTALGSLPGQSHPKRKNFCLQRTPVSHKVIEKRRRDRINRCLNELGKTVPMALAKQVTFAVLGTLHCPSPWGPQASAVAAGLRELALLRGPELLPLWRPHRPGWSSAEDSAAQSLRGSATGGPPRASFLLLQSSGKLEKAEILEMTVQYLRALHSADFPRGREKGGR